MEKKPLLSIGIIFKNEIRCLERCLESFAPLRKAIPCELVMADTGSTDGSREVAERYADILFDFPWIDDFSAARNAVIDRCSGRWYLTVDADEWLDKNFKQLLNFLKREPKEYRHINTCIICIRNYTRADQDWNYTDFMGVRMLRLSSSLRYEGKIHEALESPKGEQKISFPLDKTILHHDGYICLNDGSQAGKEKLARNMALLEKELEQDPHNMRRILQCIESSDAADKENGQLKYAPKVLQGLEEKWAEWESYGPTALRHLVYAASVCNLPEQKTWGELAVKMFPKSIYTRVDIQFFLTEHAWRATDCKEVLRWGEQYLRATKDYRANKFDRTELMQGCVTTGSLHAETDLRWMISRSYLYEKQPEKALKALDVLDYKTMNELQAAETLQTIIYIHSLSKEDTAPLIQKFWDGISQPLPSQTVADKRKERFLEIGASLFTPEFLAEERRRMETPEEKKIDLGETRIIERALRNELPVRRESYTLFAPLLGRHEFGAAAVILASGSSEEIETILDGMERIEELPINALAHGIRSGVRFPPPDRVMNIEELDNLAGRLATNWDNLYGALEQIEAEPFAGDWQTLLWARSLALAAVQSCSWKDCEERMALAQTFVKVEKAFISAYYAPEVLREGNLYALPAIHRFGWYCAEAFDALESGDTIGYVRFLREGLKSNQAMKPMVEFLLKELKESRKNQAAPELLRLAEQVRMLLAQYPADAPAVESLKQSAAYRKVAHLIEGPELGVYGGLAQ